MKRVKDIFEAREQGSDRERKAGYPQHVSITSMTSSTPTLITYPD